MWAVTGWVIATWLRVTLILTAAVGLHELGHSAFGLADEYDSPGPIPAPGGRYEARHGFGYTRWSMVSRRR